MKKLLLSLALFAGISAFAQKNISVVMEAPDNGTIVYSGVAFTPKIKFTNEGTEAITNQDTIVGLYLANGNILTTGGGQPIGFLFIPSAPLAPMASYTYTAQSLNITVQASASPVEFCLLAIMDGDTTADGNPGIDNIACNNISIALNSALSEVEAAGNSLKVYPNPVSDVLNFDMEYNKSATISIMDITGKKVENVNFAFNKATVNVSTYNKGIYLYQIVNNDGKLIKAGKFTVN